MMRAFLRFPRLFVMALGAAFGGPKPKMLRHEDASAEVVEAEAPRP